MDSNLLRRLPLNAIRAFHYAARAESFAQAAERMHLTAPAVSEQVRMLEARIGIKLFRRSSTGIELTAYGQKLQQDVAAAFDQLELAFRRTPLGAGAELVTGTMLRSFLEAWFAPRVTAIRRGVDCPVAIVASSALLDLREENIDFAVRYGHGEYAPYASELLFPEVLCPVVSAKSDEPVTLEYLRENFEQLPKVWTASEPWTLWAEAMDLDCTGMGSDDVYVSDSGAALELVRAPSYLALTRASLLDPGHVDLVPVTAAAIATDLGVYLVTHTDRSADVRLERLLQNLREAAAEFKAASELLGRDLPRIAVPIIRDEAPERIGSLLGESRAGG